jgi:hypothetical protein
LLLPVSISFFDRSALSNPLASVRLFPYIVFTSFVMAAFTSSNSSDLAAMLSPMQLTDSMREDVNNAYATRYLCRA